MSLAVAKVYVEPREHVTVCQLVNLSDKPVILPARKEIATNRALFLFKHIVILMYTYLIYAFLIY